VVKTKLSMVVLEELNMVVGLPSDDVTDNGVSWVTMVVVMGPSRQFMAARMRDVTCGLSGAS